MSESSPEIKVWATIEGKSTEGDVIKMRIQDVPDHKRNEAIDFFLDHFVFEEALSKACCNVILAASEDIEKTKSEIRKRWRTYIEQTEPFITICCLDEGEVGDVMGVSISYMVTREEQGKQGDADENVDDGIQNKKYAEYIRQETVPEIKKMIEVSLLIHYKYEAFEVFPDINSYLDDLGVLVHPKYRGLGIGSQFIKCRRLQAKALGAEMTGAWMTSFATQKAAEKEGWEVAAEFLYVDLEEEYGIKFDDGLPPSAKVMVVRV